MGTGIVSSLDIKWDVPSHPHIALLQVSSLAMFLQQLFSATAASKGDETKRQAAVAFGCIMLKV